MAVARAALVRVAARAARPGRGARAFGDAVQNTGMDAQRRNDAHSSDHRKAEHPGVPEALPGAAPASEESGQKWRRALENKLLYRSKQRGFLEMDLLVGLFAEKNVHNMSDTELVMFNQVLEQENPDLFKWLTGQEQPPESMMASPPFRALKEQVEKQLKEHRPEAAATPPGSTWLRGWDSWEKPPGQTSDAK